MDVSDYHSNRGSRKETMKYCFTGVVNRMVTDTIDIRIEVGDDKDTYGIARRVLEKFPQPHGEDGVTYCYVTNRDCGAADLVELREKEEEKNG